MSLIEPELELMFDPLPDVVPLLVVPLVVPFDIVPLVPLSVVPVPLVVPVVPQPNSARVRVSTAMRVRTALSVRFIVLPPEFSPQPWRSVLLRSRLAILQNAHPFLRSIRAG